ncbi:nucleotide 5'-monophosphate nucleosidase PpnN [Vibrio aestuarianus]|uniref:Pyrimidine/purine nucleotide 5'-monophosphate nucleosidase n=1 Tax=Vibrio aestuarianus TaxID=28171 RepID=A0AAX3U4R9_9VIBR|nr:MULTISPECIES: nucleotide 5'-monophosphate nucleosidase PpnN [Vibrio]MDE1219932.1 nucleotide 5'-monophosphate nucleosidase PpnN [Vibrio aestuarianus]MDE1225346.1 nucleotide 5'-monophosphate nucleosidase PpnN [Vibrio aestuarianus]MDE1232226.1 nucleotide 5'-monophosphate nucleosidase PpnN [Vibrio aestuarianus]MDE1318678.1 nucleotide 5'-monophosphate nucleosidase PpnN [Vibrio aestuarianus]MDE1338403.1 nucleotide 5'-monophosphate nucleosidase PpnN [Vibrio aestuarianus]
MITHISPAGSMDLLSQLEVERLKKTASSELYQLYRNCTLAVLNSGSHTDNSKELLDKHKSFDVTVMRRERGIKLELANPPEHAFVDGQIIKGIQEHLFSVLRDIVYVNMHLADSQRLNLTNAIHITNLVFGILRNAGALIPGALPNLVVCWGGHSINPTEYQYTREVGHELGLRELNICTGCGPGAMEGPMKGAAIGHAKQRYKEQRYLGLTEPSIIAAEPPNPIVNELVIMPDIEKRLEAFVRIAHGIIIFPGGAGTAEELLYILGIMMHPENASQPMPIVLTGPKESEAYFRSIDKFVAETLGDEARKHYQIVIDDPEKVAQIMSQAMPEVRQHRKDNGDAYSFNWSLKIEPEFQLPFEPTHDSMANLDLHLNQKPEVLAANLRRAFSGIVAGNVKAEGIREIERHGPFTIDGDTKLMKKMDLLLKDFVAQHRMKLPGGSAYEPCYKIAANK